MDFFLLFSYVIKTNDKSHGLKRLRFTINMEPIIYTSLRTKNHLLILVYSLVILPL